MKHSLIAIVPIIFIKALCAQPNPVPAGTRIEARLKTTVKTDSASAGDAISAVLLKPIRSGDSVVVPRGSELTGRVETIQAADRTSEGRVRLVFREIRLPDGRRASTSITNSFAASSGNRLRRYAITMSTLGAAGGLIGGKRARVTGILGGALIGFAIGTSSGPPKLPDLTLKAGRDIELELREDLAVSVLPAH